MKRSHLHTSTAKAALASTVVASGLLLGTMSEFVNPALAQAPAPAPAPAQPQQQKPNILFITGRRDPLSGLRKAGCSGRNAASGHSPSRKNTPVPGLSDSPGAVDPKTTTCLTPIRNTPPAIRIASHLSAKIA